MVQTINLNECGELVQDLLSDISGHSWEKGGRRLWMNIWYAKIIVKYNVSYMTYNITTAVKFNCQGV